MAKYTCEACGQSIDADQNIRIGCRLYPVQTQDPPEFAVTRPREIFLFHEAHAPAGGGYKSGGYELGPVMTLAAALEQQLILG
jgi:hypothetical protein